MNYLANAFGFLAVALFVLSYQIKSRKKLIAVNAASRVLYVAQYILLGTFEGALLDIVAFLYPCSATGGMSKSSSGILFLLSSRQTP